MNKLRSFSLAILMLFTCSLIFISCSYEQFEVEPMANSTVTKFLSSDTYKRHKIYINTLGNIIDDSIKTNIIKVSNKDVSTLTVPIYKNSRLAGYIEVVDLEDTKYLPNDDKYALNYVNLENFDTNTLSGSVEMIDLNFDNFKHSKIIVSKNDILSWENQGLPAELSDKYKEYRNINNIKSLRASHLCDSKNNGDVSFSECYKCINDAIDADGFSSFICDVPIAGWASCWASVSAACVYISATN